MTAEVAPRAIELDVASVAELPAYQARVRGVNPKTVREYAHAMLRGAEFPPVKVARLNGACVLLSGAHRLAALRQIGRHTVAALCYEVDHAEAVRIALADNMRPTEKLTPADKRRALLMFVDAGLNRKGRGRLMSSRELVAAALAGNASPQSALTWLAKDRPKVYAQMKQEAQPSDRRNSFDPEAEADRRAFAGAKEALQAARAALRGVRNPQMRGELLKETEAVLKEASEGAQWVPPEF